MKKLKIKNQKLKTFATIKSSAFDERGQSLVEALAALTVAVVVIVALIGLGIASMRSANMAKNNAEAAKIANREMELVLYLADSNWTNFINATVANGTYRIDYPTSSIVGSFIREGIFTRQFTTGTISANEKDVIVTVYFTTASGRHDTVLRTRVSNWH